MNEIQRHLEFETLAATGESRKRLGMDIAARRKDELIDRGTIAMLVALLGSADKSATIDDASSLDELLSPFQDHGKWRGSIPLRLAHRGIIESDGAVKSTRPSRHRGFVTRWRLVDEKAGRQLLSRLCRAYESENPPEQASSDGRSVVGPSSKRRA